MNRFIPATAALLVIGFTNAPLRAEEQKPGTAITIYSSAQPGAVSADLYRPVPGQGTGWIGNAVPGYAVVRDRRMVSLPDKISHTDFTDVAALIDPTTVSFTSLTDPKTTSVLEQNYLFDLVGPNKLLERYTGKNITVEQGNGDHIASYEGKLLSAQSGIVLEQSKGEVLYLNQYQNVRFPEKLADLYTVPTLAWTVATKKPGEHLVETAYETKGITWWADYNVTYQDGADENSGVLDLGAWVSILNQSGAGYKDAKLKLIAGTVNRPQPPQAMYMAKAARMEMAMDAAAPAPGFQQKDFFEYHLYTLGRPATIPDNSTKQIELFPQATRIKADKELVYEPVQFTYMGYPQMDQGYGNAGDTDVNIFLAFKNEEKNGLGMPLPAGRMRVNKRDDADGSLEFIGEDIIQHTPKDETVRLKLGNAFDVKGERKQVHFTIDTNRRIMEEEFLITIKNHKDKPVKVVAVEHLYRAANWEILDHEGKYEKEDAFTLHFPVEVPANGKSQVGYRVRYSW